jgi:hypothetical protein
VLQEEEEDEDEDEDEDEEEFLQRIKLRTRMPRLLESVVVQEVVEEVVAHTTFSASQQSEPSTLPGSPGMDVWDSRIDPATTHCMKPSGSKLPRV